MQYVFHFFSMTLTHREEGNKLMNKTVVVVAWWVKVGVGGTENRRVTSQTQEEISLHCTKTLAHSFGYKRKTKVSKRENGDTTHVKSDMERIERK